MKRSSEVWTNCCRQCHLGMDIGLSAASSLVFIHKSILPFSEASAVQRHSVVPCGNIFLDSRTHTRTKNSLNSNKSKFILMPLLQPSKRFFLSSRSFFNFVSFSLLFSRPTTTDIFQLIVWTTKQSRSYCNTGGIDAMTTTKNHIFGDWRNEFVIINTGCSFLWFSNFMSREVHSEIANFKFQLITCDPTEKTYTKTYMLSLVSGRRTNCKLTARKILFWEFAGTSWIGLTVAMVLDFFRLRPKY